MMFTETATVLAAPNDERCEIIDRRRRCVEEDAAFWLDVLTEAMPSGCRPTVEIKYALTATTRYLRAARVKYIFGCWLGDDYICQITDARDHGGKQSRIDLLVAEAQSLIQRRKQ